MWINWGEAPVSLEYHPGPNPGAIWAVIPAEKVAFVGDLITPGQPPFLASADLPEWIASLNILLEPEWRSYTLVSGRGGPVAQKEVRNQIDYLTKIHNSLEEMVQKKGPPEATEALVSSFMAGFRGAGDKKSMFTQRLKYGLSHYYTRHYRPSSDVGDE
jgi:glyoxylase-like metal-dependent hydrolase (beta-lactamase superfamily II)